MQKPIRIVVAHTFGSKDWPATNQCSSFKFAIDRKPLCYGAQNLLLNRRFNVDLDGKRSRWHKQKNGLPQGRVLATLLFNMYTNDQPVHPNVKSFLYVDDLCIALHENSYEEVKITR